jgi:hypothetical protein
MAGIAAFHGVDDTLKLLAKEAVDGISPKPDVTVGPLSSASTDLRVNWFLYQIDPHPQYRNMEPPRVGSRTSRGRPPLALQLHYLLTAFPGGTPSDGDQEQFSHTSLAAVMQALHSNAIIGNDDPALSPQARPLVEPLRITQETLDLEALSKIWSAAAQPMRLSVGYEVALVTVDSLERHTPGPPVRTRRVVAVPSVGPTLVATSPARVSAGVDIRVEVDGLLPSATYSLAREPADPGTGGDWRMTVMGSDGPRAVVLRLPTDALAPGARRLDVTIVEDGLTIGRDSMGLTVVPTVVDVPSPVVAGGSVELQTAHAARDVEVFLRGTPLPSNLVVFVSPTTVRITIPADASSGPAPLSLRANRVAGPTYAGLEVGP